MSEITTAAVLDGLPVGTVVADRGEERWVKVGPERWWYVLGGGDGRATVKGVLEWGPLTVAITPDMQPLSDDALIAEAGSRGMSVMDTVEAARLRALDETEDEIRDRARQAVEEVADLRAGIEALADEWEAEAGRADALVDTARRDTERAGVAVHARQLSRAASALRALLPTDDETAGA